MDLHTSLLSTAFCVLLLGGSVHAAPTRYEPGCDPGVGFNLVSWWNFETTGATVWQNAVQEVYDKGFRHVSMIPIRYVDLTTGHLLADGHAQAPELAHVAAGVARAKSLGMTVTLNPFVVPDGFSTWRGTMNFSGTEATTFFGDYQQYLLDVAQVAEDHDVERMMIGSELRALVQDSSHNARWTSAIAAVDSSGFVGQLGYAANWDSYRNGNLTSTFWENPAIDFMGVDAYFPLADNVQADASGAHPDETFISTVEDHWTEIFDNDDHLGGSVGLFEFAAARKSGSGMPVVFAEHGLIPFNRTTVQPHSEDPGFAGNVDQAEQVNGYDALLRASDMRGDRLPEIYLWHWGMDGAADSFWYTHPNGQDVGGNKFAESLGNAAGIFLSEYVSSPVVPGDATGDRCVDEQDASILADYWCQTVAGGADDGDFNHDGVVNAADASILAANWGYGTVRGESNTVPEPTMLVTLLSIAVPMLLWRRQRKL